MAGCALNLGVLLVLLSATVTLVHSTSPADCHDQIILEVLSTGFRSGSAFHIKRGLTTVSQGYRRGLNVAVFDETNADVLFTQNFDTYKNNANQFAALIKSLPPGKVVAIAVSDEATKNLNERAKIAIESLGSDQIRNLRYRGSWAFIGSKGTTPGTAIEEIDNTQAPVVVSAVLAKFQQGMRNDLQISVKSAGYLRGNYAHFSVNGVPVGGKSYRGLNVVVFSETDGSVLHREAFDTYARSAESEAFATLIDGLAPDSLVAVAVKDEATKRLTARAKDAIRQIGVSRVHHIGFRGSYAIIGRKGATWGSAVEANSNKGPVEVQYYLPLAVEANRRHLECVVHVTSYGWQNGQFASILINGVPSQNKYTRGITIAILNENDCEVSMSLSFDTYKRAKEADLLASMIEQTAAGQTVIATVLDKASAKLTERAKNALENIGSGWIRNVNFRDAWTIVGRKGAPKHSVPEMHGPQAVSLKVSVAPTVHKELDLSIVGKAFYVPDVNVFGTVTGGKTVFNHEAVIYKRVYSLHDFSGCIRQNQIRESRNELTRYPSKKQLFAAVGMESNLKGVYQGTFTLKSSLKEIYPTDSWLTTNVNSVSIDYANILKSVNIETTCAFTETKVTDEFLKDVLELDKTIANPSSPLSWSKYDQFLQKYGSHILTGVDYGARVQHYVTASSTYQYSEFQLEARSCYNMEGPMESAVGIDGCYRYSHDERNRSQTYAMNSVSFIRGGDATLRTKLQNELDPVTIQNFLWSAEENLNPIQYHFTPIWVLLRNMNSSTFDCSQQASNMASYYSGFLEFGCSPVNATNNIAMQEFVNVGPGYFQCRFAAEGCHNSDDCHTDDVASACYCYGDSCIVYDENGRPQVQHVKTGSFGKGVNKQCYYHPEGYCGCHPHSPRVVWEYADYNL